MIILILAKWFNKTGKHKKHRVPRIRHRSDTFKGLVAVGSPGQPAAEYWTCREAEMNTTLVHSLQYKVFSELRKID